MILGKAEYRALGDTDSPAQAAYAKTRRRILAKLWLCERCKEKLPRRGRLWTRRFERFLDDNFFKGRRDTPHCGYCCDPCADSREYWD